MTPAEARRKLRNIGKRRKRHDAAGDKLATDTAKVLAETRGIVSTSEAARLVKLNRSTVYQVYRPNEVRSDER